MSNRRYWICLFLPFLVPVVQTWCQTKSESPLLRLNSEGYYESRGVNVMAFDDFYPEGHQGGITVVLSGTRVAANGDVRLEPTPGQWSPVPKAGTRTTDREHQRISVQLSYPDSSKDRKGFNPLIYPGLDLSYTITTEASGDSIRLTVDLDKPLSPVWAEKAGFNLELFPGTYFGEHYIMDGKSGVFPRQANGPMTKDAEGNLQPAPMAVGKQLIVAPGNRGKEIRIASSTKELQLFDGRALHNNGWFVLRSTVLPGIARHVVEWTITPTGDPGWTSTPVIQVSQVGYHPKQEKLAVIELDKSADHFEPIELVQITGGTSRVAKAEPHPEPWGNFLRCKYLRFDFSEISVEGIFRIRYGSIESNEFEIRRDVYARNVWQPSLETFLPVQMCHMKIRDRYKVWHGLCHMDDALMAPLNHNHFDGYYQHESTLTTFAPGAHVPGLNTGGWHDAGDYDIRLESQAETVYKLALAYEFFHKEDDETSMDQETRTVELHVPDGIPDIIQQVEHGVLSIVGGYESMGRLYRGIICPTIRQYVLLGDGSTMTDNLAYEEGAVDPVLHRPLPKDDRWVFTEENAARELVTAQALGAACRLLKSVRPLLAEHSLRVAEELYRKNSGAEAKLKLGAAAELFLSTSRPEYRNVLLENRDTIAANIFAFSEVIGRVVRKLDDSQFTGKIEDAVKKAYAMIAAAQRENPYGVPYKPYIWGAGWGIQSMGVRQLFLHMGFPDLFPAKYVFHALNFVLGCHPGENTASFVSGVGANSLTVAYGVNRDEWSYIPGGVASGTALIRPDLPELKVWPYFWQQAEYVMGGGTADFILLAMAADVLLNQ